MDSKVTQQGKAYLTLFKGNLLECWLYIYIVNEAIVQEVLNDREVEPSAAQAPHPKLNRADEFMYFIKVCS